MRVRKTKASPAPLVWDSGEAEDLQHAVKLSVITKCPEKYLLIDTETGQVYQGSNEDNPYMPNYKLWKAVEK
jgi:hypothetical protein